MLAAGFVIDHRSWAPGRINLVMIATDGRNDDPKSITRPQLLAEIAKFHRALAR